MTEVSKYQTFEMQRMSRADIKQHPKNPRHIDALAKKRLTDKVSEVGLMQPLIVNKRTGNLLSGHQRLNALDTLEKNNNYSLDVSVVDVDSKVELEMLVFFNNPSAQGEWDIDVLADINLEEGVDFSDMGFDLLEVEMLFPGDDRFTHELHEDTDEVKVSKNELAGMKERRAAGAAKMAKRGNTDFYFTVVARDAEELENVLETLGLPEGTLAISSDDLFAVIESIVEEAIQDAVSNPDTEEEQPSADIPTPSDNT